jgi:GTP diphosphokinase / guanosine-3',5'-bis(diphosphate) 3'-diphosphatase
MVATSPRSDVRRSVLPWRRHQVDVAVAPLVEAYLAHHRRADTGLIEHAYEVALRAHAEQVRRSGEPYISHPIGVARILADLGLDDATIAAALLHDAVEDTELTQEQLEEEFGAEVAMMVDGVTKLDRLEFESRLAQQAATLRKLLVAMAKDIRVLLIKLADRLHNMRTIASLPDAKQVRIARETLDIYAPLAHRLGIGDLKWQLEDLAFAVLHPKRYAEIEQLVATSAPEREADLETILTELRTRLDELQIEATVSGRPKHYWSIYEKMVVSERPFSEIVDLIGVRIVVDSVKDCYAALGSVHAWWRPVQGRFKDYIAQPKFNLYQSLHTTVVGPHGRPVEVQIRTADMDRRAELGVAAHWGYKEEQGPKNATDSAWLQRLVEWQHETEDPEQYLKILKGDLESDEVYVFSPKGKVMVLPSGATPVDFAYAIHTEIGHRCIGARTNGRLVPLDALLTTGDTVEIVTSRQEGAGPSEDWLQFVQTPRARAKIRQWHSRERREDAIDAGRHDLIIELRLLELPVQELMGSDLMREVAGEMHYTELDSLYEAIGEQHVQPRVVAQRMRQRLSEGQDRLPVTAQKPSRTNARRRAAGVHAEGLDDGFIRLSKCCLPVPGDEIVGFMTRGRGVSVHRADCANAEGFSTRPDRMVEVEWDHDASGAYIVSVEVEALDRSRLLRDIAATLAEHHVNIISCQSQTSPDRIARFRFDFELADVTHLASLVGALKRVDSVYDAHRIMPGTA